MQPLLWSFIAEETCCKKNLILNLILKIKIMTDVRLIKLIQSG